jgi:type I restriction enzyme M protein
LKEGGYLAIVLPDGILTNSSLQYVRDGIEDKFRIVAVVSMPQTAFSANGAGVKSSILFLKKYSLKLSEKLFDLKTTIQIRLKNQFYYYVQIELWEKEKNLRLREMTGLYNSGIISLSEFKRTEEYKAWRDEINAEYTDKINDLKEKLQDAYLYARQQELPDYPIFMAIAEDIGYDATGKSTGEGDKDLDFINVELTKFINDIENNNI